jgi:aerobic-type carbon monoxide dehydrogenase small subunit (CoxS/CutS family)
MREFVLTVNGQKHTVTAAEDSPVLWVLRDKLEMTGTKFGCGIAECGACTIHLDGKATRSCQLLVADAVGHNITTIEALHDTEVGRRLQQAWIDEQVPQCGYCQSGQLMSAVALLASNPKPTDGDIDLAMSGNICRCATYQRIRRAIHRAAGQEVSQ